MTSTQYTTLTIDHVIEQDCLGELAERVDYDRYRALVVARIEQALPGATVSCSTGLSGHTEISDDEDSLDGMGYDRVRQECREAAEAAYREFCRGDVVRLDTLALVEYMPRHHRDSHVVAGNRGSYPHNGAERYLVTHEAAEGLVEAEGEWASILRDAQADDLTRYTVLNTTEHLS